MIWVAITAAIGMSAASVLFLTRRSGRETVVLGEQAATAQAHEAARLASGDVGPSPVPPGEYDLERGDYDLVSVTELPLDRTLQELVRAFTAWPPERRVEARHRISLEDQYTLIHFAKRCSVLALRESRANDRRMAWQPWQ